MAAKKKIVDATAPVTAPVVDASMPATVKAAKAPKAEKAPKVEKPKLETQNGISRPATGSKTARVWEISDALSAAAKSPAKRKAVIEAAMAEELNPATAATQYGRWRKFFGLAGSDEKEVAVAPAAETAQA